MFLIVLVESGMCSIIEKKSHHTHIHVEQTLALIKPDAMERADDIELIIRRNGFAILQVKFVMT